MRVLNALDRFEGRSSLKTWVFRILVNTPRPARSAKGASCRSRRCRTRVASPRPAVDPDRFRPEDDERYPGHWSAPPRDLPEERLLAAETQARIAAAIDELPANQATVIRLRDVDGWSSEEVCNALDISEVNQRVLLHRARSRVRRALEDYLGSETG